MAAYAEANVRRHEFITPEHLLYACLFFDEGKEIILHCGGDPARLKKVLEKHLDEADTVDGHDDPGRPVPRFPEHPRTGRLAHLLRPEADPGVRGYPRFDPRRKGIPRLLLPPAGRNHPDGPPQLHLSRHLGPPRRGRRTEDDPGNAGGGNGPGGQRGSDQVSQGLHDGADRPGEGRRDGSARSAGRISSSGRSRSSAAVSRTTRSTSANPGWERPRSPRGSPSSSPRVRSRKSFGA